MQVVTTQVPKTSCDLKNIIVDGGFGDPEQCNCRQELCSVKATDLSCVRKNRECQRERKQRLEKMGKKSPLYLYFKQLKEKIETLENDVEVMFNEVERTRKAKDFAQDAYNRTLNGLRVAQQESRLANQSRNNQETIMRREICLQKHFRKNGENLGFSIQKVCILTILFDKPIKVSNVYYFSRLIFCKIYYFDRIYFNHSFVTTTVDQV